MAESAASAHEFAFLIRAINDPMDQLCVVHHNMLVQLEMLEAVHTKMATSEDLEALRA